MIVERQKNFEKRILYTIFAGCIDYVYKGPKGEVRKEQMNLKSKIAVVAMALTIVAGFSKASAQGSSLNAYSPYTFYGIGDIRSQGVAVTRAMGGASIGFRNYLYVNTLNPASYSSVRGNSFLSNFDMEGQNFYARTSDAKTSYNTFNVRDIAMSFPLIKGMGVGISVTPYSSVGYDVNYYDQSPDVLGDVGQVFYSYAGSGDVTQFKAGVGYELFKNFSVGADLIYYHGKIVRTFSAEPTTITGSGGYYSLMGTSDEYVNSFFGTLGMQWTPVAKSDKVLTVGATWQIGGRMNNQVVESMPLNSTLLPGEDVINREYVSGLQMPNVVSAGFYYHTDKYSFGADYEWADWGTRNKADQSDVLSFRNTNAVRLGGQYTPNRGDVRNAFNRFTYRAGIRWSQGYVVLHDCPISDVALTMGVGIPLRMTGLSNVNLGLELGQRGTTKAGLSRENYLKFTVGFSLFGEDYWFVKVKYD